MLQRDGLQPTPEELAERMLMPEDKIRKVLKTLQRANLHGNADRRRCSDFHSAISSRIPPSSCRWTLPRPRAWRAATHDVFAGLTAREAKACMRFVRYEHRPISLEEVGKQFDVTRERIRQIEAKALRKPRHPSRSSAAASSTINSPHSINAAAR